MAGVIHTLPSTDNKVRQCALSLVVPQEVKHRMTTQPSNSTPGYTPPQRTEKQVFKQKLVQERLQQHYLQ